MEHIIIYLIVETMMGLGPTYYSPDIMMFVSNQAQHSLTYHTHTKLTNSLTLHSSPSISNHTSDATL